MNFVLLAQASGFDRFLEKLYDNLIANGRWKYYLDGLGVTLQITIFAALLGIIIGLFVAIVKVSAMNTNNIFLKIGDKICNIDSISCFLRLAKSSSSETARIISSPTTVVLYSVKIISSIP